MDDATKTIERDSKINQVQYWADTNGLWWERDHTQRLVDDFLEQFPAAEVAKAAKVCIRSGTKAFKDFLSVLESGELGTASKQQQSGTKSDTPTPGWLRVLQRDRDDRGLNTWEEYLNDINEHLQLIDPETGQQFVAMAAVSIVMEKEAEGGTCT